VRTLGYAVLGLLAVQPRTGYDIAKLMKVPIGYMWTASHSRIYPELQALQAAHLVDYTVLDGPGPRDTRLYTITAEGRDALQHWADSALPPQPARSELMLRVRTLWTVSPERALRFIADVRLDCEHRLATYHQIDQQFAEEGDLHHRPDTPEFWSYATLRAGISYEQHLINWCNWVTKQVQHHAGPPQSNTRWRAPRPVDSSNPEERWQ
jgi:DNA-binding PadR family transcriptional regulator